MSDMLDDIIKRNFLNLSLDDPFPSEAPQPKGPGPRLGRSLSSCLAAADLWPLDVWSPTPSTGPKADRSMSLTEPSYVSPPPGFPPLGSPLATPRYKTELCRTFQESAVCKYGAKCQFAHGEAELRGLNRHPKYKTEACRTFYNFGYCPYGARCHFLHEEKLTPLTARFQSPGSRLPLRQSVSFAGFMASRGSPSPPSFQEGLDFTRAPSVSPPPADLLTPVFTFGQRQLSDWTGAVPPCRACGHGNTLPAVTGGAGLQRCSSGESLSDRDSYSGGSSGTQSPDVDSTAGRRLTVFTRLSVSD